MWGNKIFKEYINVLYIYSSFYLLFVLCLIHYMLSARINPLHVDELLGHLGELSELNDGFATGELSEGSLESIMKILRRYETTLARNTSFVDNATDCLKRIWLQGDPELRLHKPKPKPRRNKFVSDDDKLVKSFFK